MARTVGFRADARCNAEFLMQLAAQAVLVRLSRLHLAPGKLPFQRKSAITPTLTNQQSTSLLNQSSYHSNYG